MTARQAARARTLALAGAALAVVLLGGCTSSFLGTGLADGPAEPDPQPSGTATAEPTAAPPVDDFPCGDILLDRPGNYVLGDCRSLTVEGEGIDVTFGELGTLTVRGDRADVVGGDVGSILLEGRGNDVAVLGIGQLRIRGEGNTVVADAAIGSVVVDGNENVVTAAEGIGSTIDNGLLNEIE